MSRGSASRLSFVYATSARARALSRGSPPKRENAPASATAKPRCLSTCCAMSAQRLLGTSTHVRFSCRSSSPSSRMRRYFVMPSSSSSGVDHLTAMMPSDVCASPWSQSPSANAAMAGLPCAPDSVNTATSRRRASNCTKPSAQGNDARAACCWLGLPHAMSWRSASRHRHVCSARLMFWKSSHST